MDSPSKHEVLDGIPVTEFGFSEAKYSVLVTYKDKQDDEQFVVVARYDSLVKAQETVTEYVAKHTDGRFPGFGELLVKSYHVNIDTPWYGVVALTMEDGQPMYPDAIYDKELAKLLS